MTYDTPVRLVNFGKHVYIALSKRRETRSEILLMGPDSRFALMLLSMLVKAVFETALQLLTFRVTDLPLCSRNFTLVT